MKSLKRNLDYVKVIKYSSVFLGFLIFNYIETPVYPYSTALFASVIANGYNLIVTSLLYLLSFIVTDQSGYMLSSGICMAILVTVMVIYNATKTRPKAEIVIYTAISLLAFVMLGNSKMEIPLEKRLFVALFTTVLTLVLYISIKAIKEKGLKYKIGYEEFLSIFSSLAIIGIGISNLFSPYVWKTLSVLIILLCSYLLKSGLTTVISAFLGITYSLYFNNISFVSVFIVWGLGAESISKLSRHLSGITVALCDYVIQMIFNIYNPYVIQDFICIIIASALFSLTPTKLLKELKDNLNSFREKQLARETINRNRLMLSNRLYELSSVFTEMANTFSVFKKDKLDEQTAKPIVEKEIISSVCEKCENRLKCKVLSSKSNPFNKIIDIGFAKGRISLIDVPKEISGACLHLNNVIYCFNKLLADYRAMIIENMNFSSGKDLISEEALGISEVLKGLALESCALLKYQNKLERTLSLNLFKKGFKVSELLIYGEGENTVVSLILTMSEFSLSLLSLIISKTVGFDMEIAEKSNITEDKTFLSFRKSADYDAVFGIATVKKDGSELSGDTHSVTRIKNDMFLVALSDGMGSGKDANKVSSVSLSLIESFYKAGLKSSLILQTVNKLLAINTEDSFTALDISVIDLKTCSADFIKYGSPYGFIIGKDGIKIIEGTSLPLGILNELKPAVLHTFLNEDDIVLLLTDGISDAFSSSAEIIDYLHTLPALNPQTLVNDVMSEALRRTGGEKKDDMTALAVRVFKKQILA